jgi:hypothetical protein
MEVNPMKLTLNINLEEALLLSSALKKMDVNFIHSRICKYEVDNMSIENIRMGIKRIIKTIDNFDKECSIFYSDAVQLMEWLGVQNEDDTQELLGISIVTYEDEEEIDNMDRILCNLYGDLSHSIKQYKLYGGEM